MQQYPSRRSANLRTAAVAASVLLAVTGVGLVAAPATAAPSATASPAAATTPITPKPVTPEVPVDPAGETLGAVTGVERHGAAVTLTAERGAFRVTFLESGTFRLEADPTGSFTDPANTPQGDPARTANIVVGADTFDGGGVKVTQGTTIRITSKQVTVDVDRATGRISAHLKNGTPILEESSPLTFGAGSATQHLRVGAGEQFLGGGMQNGRSVHTGATINIARNFDWDDDGYPNAVPYYMSSQGYGVLRNTFARGSYDFAAGTTTHEERRFDAY
ncbi:alpha-glucosidase domain-containing protein [Agromyces sp. LHK192]|uniref:alpha-glucosidase domain-containing protein n=1 Tax=Agromyces sp. LHK192 TaxID=2498704 RepID=UPI001F0B93E8|nr:alpha-glucosidase domain-containing protein [Agromyces sp. LHK192]